MAVAVLTGSLAAIMAGALTTACSLDWAVRAGPAEASVAEGGADVVIDAAFDDAPDSATEDAPVSPDAAACDALAANVVVARKKARECQLGTAGQCTTTVDDECGCKVVITTAGAANTTAYTSAVSALVTSCGQPAACASTACPQIGLPASWACLAPDDDVHCRP